MDLGLIMFWTIPSKDEGLASPPLSADCNLNCNSLFTIENTRTLGVFVGACIANDDWSMVSDGGGTA